MNAPAAVTPPYKHTPLFPLGVDTAPYRKLTADGVRSERVGGHDLVFVEREALRALAEAAFTDINHLLRPGHLKQLRAILDDPQASDNDKFVAYDFLKNANIAARGTPTSSAICAIPSSRPSPCSRRKTPSRTCRRRSRSTPRAAARTTAPTSSSSSPRAAAPPTNRSCSRRRRRSSPMTACS